MNSDALEEYIEAHSTAEHPYLHRLYRATMTTLLNGRMASGHLQGLLLQMLARLVQPRRALEIGTFSGYSALSIASGMPSDGVLYTFEKNDEIESFTRPWIDGSPFDARIVFEVGDALESLKESTETFDFIFIDADKRHYSDYYAFCLPRLRKGGLLLADNTLWDGHVVDPAYDRDAQTLGIRDFNDRVAADPAVSTFILPLRDGLTFIQKR